jgi:hypothetical protein
MNEADKAVAEYLKSIGVAYSTVYLGERTEDKWKHDAWSVTFARRPSHGVEHFEFRTGTGLRKANKAHKTSALYREVPVAPTAASVLYSLTLDSSAVGISFASWCSEFGYDTDSREAERIYRACQDNADKLARILSSAEQSHIATLLLDY